MFYKKKSDFHINLTPLIDISFILIIILFQAYHINKNQFLKESELSIIESKENKKDFKLEEDKIIIHIDKNQNIIINNEFYNLNTSKFEKKFKSVDKKSHIYLLFDKNISIQFLFKVYDAIKKLNMKNIKILTMDSQKKNIP